MTREIDEALPEELREAIESERAWDTLPPQLEERLALRIGHSLASMGVPTPPQPPSGPAPALPTAPPTPTLPAVPPVSPLAVGSVASAPLKWVVICAGGLLVGGGLGAGTVIALEPSAPRVERVVRHAPTPAVEPAPAAPPLPLPLSPPAPPEVNEAHSAAPAVAPSSEDKQPPSPKPPAAARPQMKRESPPRRVETVPAPESPPRSEAPLFGRDGSLLEAARSSNATGRYADALSAVTQHEQEYPSSQFEQEREALRIQALVGLGRQDEARALARRFEQRFPESILLEAIRQAVGAE